MSVPIWLRRLSKITTFSTLFLIFAGGMVTSTGSGLSVPDWPLSYGSLFPPMIGGVFYEHGHRMIAATVGFLTIVMVISLAIYEKRKWMRNLGFFAIAAVISQGILGGLTVLFFLPPQISISHAVLAQTFYILTILIAYSLSIERENRPLKNSSDLNTLLKINLTLIIAIYFQLILGALMRHTKSGLAIYDFPTMAGEWWPSFSDAMLKNINVWRFDHDLDYVTMPQVIIHFIHRLWASIILIIVCVLNFSVLKCSQINAVTRKTLFYLNGLVGWQITLGILTVLTVKSPTVTSLHVVSGAATLGMSVLLFLRLSPLSIKELMIELSK